MKKRYKLVIALLNITLLFSLSACGKTNEEVTANIADPMIKKSHYIRSICRKRQTDKLC